MKKTYIRTFILFLFFTFTFTVSTWAKSESGIETEPISSEVLELLNQNREAKTLSLLTLDPQITSVSRMRVQEISQFFSHTRPDGRRYSTAFGDADVSYRNCGEILAYGFLTPEQVVNAWMSSPGHYAIITSEVYTHVGISHMTGDDDLSYWVVEFLSR